MDDKEIDDMFFKIYGQANLTHEYKEVARNSNAYAGFRLYVRMEMLMSKVLYTLECNIKEIIKLLTK